MKKRYLIVGNSAAGTGALEAIRKSDRESAVTIVSDEDGPLYSRCLLSYFIAGKIEEGGLRFRPADFHRALGADVIAGRKVVSVDPARQQVTCDDGKDLAYDALLIATGGSPKIPAHIPGDLDGVFALHTLADAAAIRGRAGEGRRAVVLGGGLIGMKAAFALAQRACKVTVVVRSRHVLSQMIDFDAAQLVMARLRESGIEVLTGADVAAVEPADRKLAGARIEGEKNQTVPCEILIAAKGVEPNKQLIAGTKIEQRTGIVTDAKLRTSIPNIFAAGDVAETFDMALGRHAVNALWTCAVQQGKIAGLNMAGKEREYDGSVGMNSINFAGVDLISFGVVRPQQDAGYEILVDNRPEAGIYRKVVLKDNRIKGLILVNRIDHAGVLLSLLARKVDVGEYKDNLLDDGFSYAQVLGHGGREEWQRFWNAGHAVRS